MQYLIRMGIPEMLNFWNDLEDRFNKGRLNKNEVLIFTKLGKTLYLLSNNPFHPSLQTHEIKPLSIRYGLKVWQSYVENNISRAKRIYWVYGPNKNDITIIGFEPHPNDRKANAYSKIKLSRIAK
ncbi:MAG: hypothetical protein HUJ61_07155 [Bacilli bacterium]|nr:hypothetical protein [Bacilli bacterium]